MIKLTYHSKLRYVQRVLKIVNEKEAAQYLRDNYEEVTDGLMLLCANSKLVYENYIYDREQGAAQNYYIYEGIVIVTTHEGNKIITLYTSWYDMENEDEKTDLTVLLKELTVNNEENKNLRGMAKKKRADMAKVEYMIEQLEIQVEKLKEELEKKVEEGKDTKRLRQGIQKESRRIMGKIKYGNKMDYECSNKGGADLGTTKQELQDEVGQTN